MAVPTPPGIYKGLTYAEYDAIDAIRRSVLDRGVTHSLAHLKYDLENKADEGTEATWFGQALHAAVLEPDRFEEKVVLGPINPKTGEPFGRDTKACREFAESNPDLIVLGKGDRDRIKGMGEAIRAHSKALSFLKASDETELTLVWDDAATGVRMKAKLDTFSSLVGMGDLKSTTCARGGAFGRSMYDYGYHRQAAMYIDGAKALGMGDVPFTIIAVEKEAPHGVALYTVGDESIAVGRVEYREVLREVVKARQTGVWPGYGEDVMHLDVPEWVFKRFHGAA